MSIAYLLIGGNLGNRLAYLQKAGTLIEQNCGNIVHSSAIYETAAWGVRDQPGFYNQALAVKTSLSPENLMRKLLDIEREMGRERTLKMGPRIIDLDILLMDGLTMHTDLLTIPHPALPFRRFALLPLCEIGPELIHPVLHKSIRELLADCTDELDVQKKYPSAN
ncbi:MAG: 2-amino-4-hydroxy-6-hydroxymethyldihydropteridine diphosphokinase [Bacteroidota bacterium]|nr:2-amino-4-hydroxy-6-hydroxymethyldihydropteridine diphosphokinase [Bacteroidota bacterium]